MMKKTLFRLPNVLIAVSVLSAESGAVAAILTSVPMQGGMVMPVITYQETDGRLHVTAPTDPVELVPLLVSHPLDGFDPAAPWFDALDPSRQGLAFSRRYGFVMGTGSDLLPEGTQIWIRRLSSSPGLEVYRNMPGTWEPIFGTTGSSNALYWNTQMFHPAFTAPPGTNSYSAVFEAYLVNTNSGLEVSGSKSGLIELSWTAVPDGRPVLSIQDRARLSWSSTSTNWMLEAAASPLARWTPVTNLPSEIGEERIVTVDATDEQRYFRLRRVLP